MIEAQEPINVGFPLRGEWLSPNTPGTKIPSHGTDQLGTRYAYDFIQVDWERKGWPAYRGSLLQYLLFGIPINEYYCWGQEVCAPCDGIIVQAEDGYKERKMWLTLIKMPTISTPKKMIFKPLPATISL